MGPDQAIESVTAHALEVPTDGPDGREQDGTLEWSSTTRVPVEVRAGGHAGVGCTDGDVSVAAFIDSEPAGPPLGADALARRRDALRRHHRTAGSRRSGRGPEQVDLSAHCAPAVSAHAFCAVRRLRHLEYFHDHVRIERILFEGALSPAGGALCPASDRPGLGLEVKWADAERYRAHGPTVHHKPRRRPAPAPPRPPAA